MLVRDPCVFRVLVVDCVHDVWEVRAEDKLGNAKADAATEAVMDVRRALVNARGLSYPIIQQLHRFLIAISRVSVNHDGRGGTAPDPLV